MEPPSDLRFKLTVHYDGSAFHGWQLQPDRRTVQGVLESALSTLADSPRRVTGSGRTDAGVHATGQVASVDMPARWEPPTLARSLNALLDDDVWVTAVEVAGADFHPRYDAVARTYRYEVGLVAESASPFHARWCWPLREPVDRAALADAAGAIVGEHSFKAFAKAGQPERGERCRVQASDWSHTEIGLRYTVTADRYLHHMVRYLVGTMIDVGRGRRPLDDVARLLDNDPEVTTSPPAPPQGLFLAEVRYPAAEAPDPASPTSPRTHPTPA